MSAINHPALWAALQRSNATEVAEQLFPHMFPRDVVSSAIPEETGPQQPMCRYPDLVERPAASSPATPTAGTAGVGVFSERAQLRMQPPYERFVAELYELLSNDRVDEAHDLVRAEHRAIHGRS